MTSPNKITGRDLNIAMTPAQRKKAERQRKRAAGLAPLEIWALPEHHLLIKKMVMQWTFHAQNAPLIDCEEVVDGPHSLR